MVCSRGSNGPPHSVDHSPEFVVVVVSLHLSTAQSPANRHAPRIGIEQRLKICGLRALDLPWVVGIAWFSAEAHAFALELAMEALMTRERTGRRESAFSGLRTLLRRAVFRFSLTSYAASFSC